MLRATRFAGAGPGGAGESGKEIGLVTEDTPQPARMISETAATSGSAAVRGRFLRGLAKDDLHGELRIPTTGIVAGACPMFNQPGTPKVPSPHRGRGLEPALSLPKG